MDFPIFHLDFAGNRMLIAGIAVLHVMINHALAVGAIPLVTMMELHGARHHRPDWDRLAYRTLAVCFIITTSVGALTGVGIWFATSLVNPAAIGSLIRVFFGAWFVEWIVFCLEVIAIMAYFLSWKRMGQRHKRAHIALGVALSVLSWLTYRDVAVALAAMAIAVLLIAAWGALAPRRLPRAVLVLPFGLVLVMLGSFERVREFIRKPFVIANYMYANGIRADVVPLLQEDGVLAHATYVSSRTITPANREEAGRELFLICCTRCHTTSGVNSVLTKLTNLYGPGPGTGTWSRGTCAPCTPFARTCRRSRAPRTRQAPSPTTCSRCAACPPSSTAPRPPACGCRPTLRPRRGAADP